MMRRAKPSSWINAAAAVNWSIAASRTHFPRSSSARNSTAAPSASPAQLALPSGPASRREEGAPAATIALDRDVGLMHGIFVETNKVAECDGKADILCGAERIDA